MSAEEQNIDNAYQDKVLGIFQALDGRKMCAIHRVYEEAGVAINLGGRIKQLKMETFLEESAEDIINRFEEDQT